MTNIMRADDYLPDTWDGAVLPAKQDPTQRLRDWVDLFREVVKAAEFLSKTPFVPKEMLGKPADVAAAIMKGHELGMDPLDALANIYVIHGRVGFYAEFQRRRIIQAGHTFRVIESGDTRCIVEGIRKEGGEPQRASFSADQARKAGLDLGKYPADKLIARATSRSLVGHGSGQRIGPSPWASARASQSAIPCSRRCAEISRCEFGRPPRGN